MAEIFRMPSVSPTMETGTIAAWRIAVGQAFTSGAVIAEVGTDKANMEAEIFEDGVLLAQLVPEGDEVPLNAPIAIWGKAGDDTSALEAQARAELAALRAGPAASVPVPPGSPAPASAPGPAPAEAPAPAPSPAPRPSPAPAPTPARSWMGRSLATHFGDPPGDLRVGAASPVARRVIASPLARALAAERGVDLQTVRGSGPGGRVVRADVETAGAPSAPPSGGAARPADVTHKLTPMRKTIARRLLESHQQIPTFYLTVSLDGAGFVALRDALKAQLPDASVSYNDMLIAAVARALREVPVANSQWTDQGIVQKGSVDVGVAVALPEGLITPVVRDADRLRLTEIGATVRELAARAKAGKLKPEEYTGGTFTISNLGMMGIDRFTAIINPPEVGILAVGRMAQVPVVTGGQLGVGWRFDVTLTCDHRVLDGAAGAAFLQVVRRYVETPALLLA